MLSVNSAHDALDALTQSLGACRPGTLWADLNTAAPALKQELGRAAGGTVQVVDVAVMAPVPPTGLRTPLTMSGPGAAATAEILTRYGARVEVLDGPVGLAATRKLLRSVFYKGLAAAVVEALEAARAAGLEDWLTGNIRHELETSTAATLDRLVEGSTPTRHAAPRRWRPPPTSSTSSASHPGSPEPAATGWPTCPGGDRRLSDRAQWAGSDPARVGRPRPGRHGGAVHAETTSASSYSGER